MWSKVAQGKILLLLQLYMWRKINLVTWGREFYSRRAWVSETKKGELNVQKSGTQNMSITEQGTVSVHTFYAINYQCVRIVPHLRSRSHRTWTACFEVYSVEQGLVLVHSCTKHYAMLSQRPTHVVKITLLLVVFSLSKKDLNLRIPAVHFSYPWVSTITRFPH